MFVEFGFRFGFVVLDVVEWLITLIARGFIDLDWLLEIGNTSTMAS